MFTNKQSAQIARKRRSGFLLNKDVQKKNPCPASRVPFFILRCLQWLKETNAFFADPATSDSSKEFACRGRKEARTKRHS